MSKSMGITAGMLLATGIFGSACEEWMVGAPCTPETDKGEFTKDMSEYTFGVETRSVQCETAICLTKTQKDATKIHAEGQNDFEIYKDSQMKYSFCSCRCMDADGHKYDRNNDKYDDLCECPANTRCISVLGSSIGDAPEKIKGSYCIPNCIDEACTGPGEKCMPSSDSKEPWKWKCKVPK